MPNKYNTAPVCYETGITDQRLSVVTELIEATKVCNQPDEFDRS